MNLRREKVLFNGDTDLEHYQVVDMIYEGRPARVLFAGNRTAAMSGVATDDSPDLLFDYNQRFFELASGLRPGRVLVIGGGTYTLPMVLAWALPEALVDVVELDPGLDDLARRFFGLKPHKHLRIFHGDGRAFLEANRTPYDLIIVDAFIKLQLPPRLATLQAAKQLRRNLTASGIVAVNTVSPYFGRGGERLRAQFAAYEQVFSGAQIYPADHGLSLWQSQNFLIVAQKGRPRELPYLRYEALAQPEALSTEVLLDEV